jgi:hypothetical protein
MRLPETLRPHLFVSEELFVHQISLVENVCRKLAKAAVDVFDLPFRSFDHYTGHLP